MRQYVRPCPTALPRRRPSWSTSRSPTRDVATITLDSPHNRNALSRQLVTELFERLEAAEADDAVKVVVIRSSGRVFCSGADLSEATSVGMEQGAREIVRLQRLIVTMAKPVVVEVGGPVRAGGIGIVAAADIAIAAEDATFALTEVKLGLAAAIISLTVHHRMHPRAAALTTLGGEVFSGTEAAAYGLVTQAVPADDARRGGTPRCARAWRPAPRRGCASRSGSSTRSWWRGSTPAAPRWRRSAPPCSPPTRRARR